MVANHVVEAERERPSPLTDFEAFTHDGAITGGFMRPHRRQITDILLHLHQHMCTVQPWASDEVPASSVSTLGILCTHMHHITVHESAAGGVPRVHPDRFAPPDFRRLADRTAVQLAV